MLVDFASETTESEDNEQRPFLKYWKCRKLINPESYI